MLTLALRNLLRHHLRTAISIGAIATGVIGLILSGGFVHDILAQLGEAVIHSQTGHLQLSKSGFQRSGSRKPEQFRIKDVDKLEARIRTIDGVADAMARVSFSGLVNNGHADLAIIGEGMDPERENRLGTYLAIVSGHPLTSGDSDGIMVGYGVAKAMKLAPGDRATLMLTTDAGALNTLEVEVVGVFQTYSKDYDARAVRVSLEAAHRLMDSQDVNTVVVSLQRTMDTERIAGLLAHLLAGEGFEVWTWQQLNDFYAKAVKFYDSQFAVLRIVILLMILLSVANAVNMSLSERIPEFGTMGALGDTSRFMRRLILVETFLLGVVGAFVGVAMGMLLAIGISAVGIRMPPPPNADLGYTARIQIIPEIMLGAFLIGVFASTLAGIPSAVRVGRIPIADALRHAI